MLYGEIKEYLETFIECDTLNEKFDYSINNESSTDIYLKELKKFNNTYNSFFMNKGRLVFMINNYEIILREEDLKQILKLFLFYKKSNLDNCYLIAEFLLSYFNTINSKEYKRNGLKSCESPILKECELDKIFIFIFDDFFNGKDKYLYQVLNEYRTVMNRVYEYDNSNNLQKNIDVINKKKDKLLDLSLKGIISDSELKKRNDFYNNEICKLESDLMIIKNYNTSSNISKKLKETENEVMKKINIENSLSQLIRLFIDKIEISKIDNDRKHIRMDIYFNCNISVITRELYL